MNEVIISGCSPTPLASYLKALGVFRLVTEQIDPMARGFWRNDNFILISKLGEEDLVRFFLDLYSPSPVINPWGGRSGFYKEQSEKSARQALDTICKCKEARFISFRESILAVLQLLDELGIEKKPEKDLKHKLICACRAKLPDQLLAWLDVVVVLTNNNQTFPPLLGTGGNEGSGSYTSGYAQSIVKALIKNKSESAIKSSLFRTADPDVRTVDQTPGQFDPGRTGGTNQGVGIEGKTRINPWDYVLMIEGTFLFAGSATRKYGYTPSGRASFPFMVRASTVGYTSSSLEDAEKAREELWLPIWKNPTPLREIQELFAEGRAQVKRRYARSGIDFFRAVAQLGVDRGITEFNRIMLLERRGKGYYVALPAGRHPVRELPSLRLLDDLDPILSRLDSFLRKFRIVPATFKTARRRIDEAIYQVCIKPGPEKFSSLIRALGYMESLIAQRDRNNKPALNTPLTGLRPRWIAEADDGTPELRIAAAIASIRNTEGVGPIRSNMAGVDPRAPWKWAEVNGQKHWYGVSLAERLGGVLKQRMMDAERHGVETIPIQSHLSVSPGDVVPFLYACTDDEKIEELLWGFSLIKWSLKDDLAMIRTQWRGGLETLPIPRCWALLKLLYIPEKVRDVSIRSEPRTMYLLQAGRLKEAVDIARRRLFVSRLDPLPVTHDDSMDPIRLLAGLIIPVTKKNLLESLVLKKKSETT